MNFLLKIVEGPMKGAEVALVNGTRVKVGSSDACDVVLADSTLGETAFELDVAENSVTLITPDGDQRALDQFEVCDFGTTSIAIGPADSPWGELKRPAAKSEQSEMPPEAPAEEPKAEPEANESGSAEAPQADDGGKEDKKKKGGCLGCIVWLLVLLVVLAVAAWLAWRYWPPAREYVDGLLNRIRIGEQAPKAVEQYQRSEEMSLSEIASQHGLELLKEDGKPPMLKGNLRRRTERQAIRALAVAADPNCRFDITDDESMLACSQELLFALTEGAIKAVAASNRVVTLTGYAPSPAALEHAIRGLNADVKGIDSLDTTGISVGGIAPAAVAESSFVKETPLVGTTVKKPAKTTSSGRSDYPIAGILTKPYPCVVMRNGHRVMEGAQIGTATLERIEADKLILRESGKTFEWVP